MAGQLRSTAGFYGGSGVTPSPTPTPHARLARFILEQYGASGEVQVLTDTYGRILTQYTQDGDYRTACVWVPGDSRLDWDTAGDQELVTLLGKYGYNDALTIVDNDVTISDNGETETLTWDSEAMDFTVDVDMFQNGAQNMYFCTVNDGNRDVTILVDEDGKAIQVQTLGGFTDVLFSVANNGTEIDTITSDATYSRQDIINACGGAVNVTALDAGESVFLLVMGTHIQYCNGDNTTTTPTVNEIPFTLYVAKAWANAGFSEEIHANSSAPIYIQFNPAVSLDTVLRYPEQGAPMLDVRWQNGQWNVLWGGGIAGGNIQSDEPLTQIAINFNPGTDLSGKYTEFYPDGTMGGQIE